MGLPFLYSNTHNRVGDEIQMTAVLKYYKQKFPGRQFLYRDRQRFVSARDLFPDGLVEFTDKNPSHEILNEHNLWIFAPFLRSRGIYTELRDYWKYQLCVTTSYYWDVVFCPLIMPDYNAKRAWDREFAFEWFRKILEKYPNSLMILDGSKFPVPPEGFTTSNVLCSPDFLSSFDEVVISKVFIAGDSGLAHFAGACGHPNMILLYGNQEHDKKAFDWQRMEMSEVLDEPELAKNPEWSWDSRPCCNPDHFDTMWLENNKVSIEDGMNLIERRMING
jgi:hypothetical protein